MIIQFCLSLAAKSASAYDDIRYDEKSATGILILPSRRRLRDYKYYIRPGRGFNKNIINELKNKMKNFSYNEKFFASLMDEMKIQSNLVWDKHAGEFIGYVDLGDTNSIMSHWKRLIILQPIYWHFLFAALPVVLSLV